MYAAPFGLVQQASMPDPVKCLGDVKENYSDFFPFIYSLTELVIDFYKLSYCRVSW